MATTHQVPLEEYLTHTYESDMDYDEGVLQGRNLGEERHSRSQLLIGSHTFAREKEWGIRAFVSQRIKIAPRKFCVADHCATLATTPREPILTVPPLFTIEILSPDDDFKDVQIKAAEILVHRRAIRLVSGSGHGRLLAS